ncbi:MAG: 30S ribosomal protein S4 [Candidatus Omnitrophota bacterium]
MAKDLRATCRKCRREGMKLFLKGIRCNGPKCAVTRRAYAPGQHGQARTKLSNYGIQLREKQKVKRYYGLLEQQFRNYFELASKTKGVTGKVLIQLLERRLDSVILRTGFAVSHNQARQIVRHNFVYVNSRRVNIPSYLIKTGDVIEIRAKDKTKENFKQNLEQTKDVVKPGWLELDQDNLTAKVVRLPEKEDLQLPIQEQLIVELYSK